VKLSKGHHLKNSLSCNRKTIPTIAFAFALLVTCGCADSKPDASNTAAPPVKRAAASDDPPVLLPRELRRKLNANDNAKFVRSGNDIVEAQLVESGVKSIEALKGVPLRFLDLGMTSVSDISPVAGMPLETLILEDTPVADLSPVKGMSLKVLYLQNTKVTDLSVLKGMPIEILNLKSVPVTDLSIVAELPLNTLWIPDTKIDDISPLQGKAMVSLDIEGTAVSSLAPLAEMATLKRLNIARTPITDVSPLKGIKLQRITLTPDTVREGMDVLKDMPSLTEIRTTMEGPAQSAAEFWAKYDRGVWNIPAKTDNEAPAQEGK